MVSPADEAVLDASVAAKWYLTDEQFVAECRLLFDRFVAGTLAFVAPLHIQYEVPNAIMVASRRQPPRLSEQAARAVIQDFIDLGIPTVHDDALVSVAMGLAYQHGCAFYDGFYVALSQRLSLPLITADNKLYQAVGHLPDVIWIADYLKP
jgi:predicted nucleic acid-binding protein